MLDATTVNALTSAAPLGAPLSTDNGVSLGADAGGQDATFGGDHHFRGCDGPSTWTLRFLIAVEIVHAKYFTVMTDVTIGNCTLIYDGAPRLRAYDISENLVSSRASSVASR